MERRSYTMAECNLADAVLREAMDEVVRLSGETFQQVEDSLGIGHFSMVSPPGVELVMKRLRPRLEELRRNNPPRRAGTNWRQFTYGNCNPPALAACYAIFGDGELLYVGSTECLAARTRGHKIQFQQVIRAADGGGATRLNVVSTPWGDFKNVTIKYRPAVKFGDWAMVELRLIRRLQPRGNTRGIIRTR